MDDNTDFRTKPIEGRLWRLLCGLDEDANKGLPPGCGGITIERARNAGLIEQYSPEGFSAVAYWRRTPRGDELHQQEAETRRPYPAPWGRRR